MEEKRKAAEDLVRQLMKRSGIRPGSLVIASEIEPRKATPIGIYAMDRFLGGGILDGGTIYHFRGIQGSGKTIAALYTCKAFIDAGKPVVWVSVESTFPDGYAKWLGLDLDQVTVIRDQPAGEDYLDAVKVLLYDKETHSPRNIYGLVVIDSWAALPPAEEVEKTEKEGMAQQLVARSAMMSAKFLRLIVGGGCLGDASVIIINQLRASLDMYNPTKPSPGGHSMLHFPYVSLLFSTRSSTRIEVGEGKNKKQIGHTVHLKMEKNKTGRGAPPGSDSEYIVIYGVGVDDAPAILSHAREVGLIEERVSDRYVIPLPDGGESEKIHGWTKTVEYVSSTGGLMEFLEEKLREKCLSGSQ